MRVEMLSTRTPPIVCMSSAVNGPNTKRARVILAWNGMWQFLYPLPLVAVALFFQNLQAADFFGRHITPRDAEMRGVELQFQQPLEQPPGGRVRPRVVKIIQLAVRAAVDGELPVATVRAGAGRVGVVRRAHRAALPARHIVGVRTAARAIRSAIAQLFRMDRAVNQQPELERRHARANLHAAAHLKSVLQPGAGIEAGGGPQVVLPADRAGGAAL